MRPRATIAIPTFERRDTLHRSLRSAQEQTVQDIEIVVSDNASGDGTRELLQDAARDDSRIRVMGQTQNRGMVANLESALRLADGEHVMLLSDDDWLAPGCLESGLRLLDERPDAMAAVSEVHYTREGTEVNAGQPRELSAPDPARRVNDYFRAVGADHGNSWMYALVRRPAVAAMSPLRNVLGFDWLHVAELAFLGDIGATGERLLFRELGGTSESTDRNVSESGLPRLHAKAPHLAIAREVAIDIGRRSPVYAPLGRAKRARLAATCSAAIPARNLHHVAFHLAPRALQQRWHAR